MKLSKNRVNKIKLRTNHSRKKGAFRKKSRYESSKKMGKQLVNIRRKTMKKYKGRRNNIIYDGGYTPTQMKRRSAQAKKKQANSKSKKPKIKKANSKKRHARRNLIPPRAVYELSA